jgi:hypothetical protein
MAKGKAARATTPEPIDLAAERERRAGDTEVGEAIRRSLARLVASVAARWRGHEPEIAILGATTLILAIAAVFAGADLLFTSLVVAVAAIIIWSPWRRPD